MSAVLRFTPLIACVAFLVDLPIRGIDSLFARAFLFIVTHA